MKPNLPLGTHYDTDTSLALSLPLGTHYHTDNYVALNLTPWHTLRY